MKRFFMLSLLVVFACSVVPAEEQSYAKSDLWKSLSEKEKVFYVLGIIQGVYLSIGLLDGEFIDLDSKHVTVTADEVLYGFTDDFSEHDTVDLIERLDDFYKNPKNAEILVINALCTIVG